MGDRSERRFQVIGKGNKQRWCFYSGELSPVFQSYLKHYHHPKHPALFMAQQRFSKQVSRLSYHTAYEQWKMLTQPYLELEAIRIHMESHLKRLLRAAGYVDQGTGSTFKALERRGLIECDGEAPELDIKMTRLGRQVIRAGTNEPIVRKTRTPQGMLSQKAWCALTLAYQGREEGLAPSQNDPYHYLQGIHI